jgi:malate dehydrogenase (oxaloacetate-decarboxylating)
MICKVLYYLGRGDVFMGLLEEALLQHEAWNGKLEIRSKASVRSIKDLSIAYTPGVAEPCKEIFKNPSTVFKYTIKKNCVGVVSDGTAVLGLGDIGPEAALPVMEGKAVLFKEFAGIDAFPICLNTKDTDEIVKAVQWISPVFGGINLEDISAPRCFEIERRLKESLDIPVFHDDQHGTAIVVLAGLINALRIVSKKAEHQKVVINGAGAAGTAITTLLFRYGFKNITVCDKQGIIYIRAPWLNWAQKELSEFTNPDQKQGSLKEALRGADIFIGVSAPGIVSKEMIASMNRDAIVFAMANPVPEIMPELAIEAGARIVGSGRSDYPNQVNNVLVFPGIFKGALRSRKQIADSMKLAVAEAVSSIIPVSELREDNILPKPFHPGVADTVANAVLSID